MLDDDDELLTIQVGIEYENIDEVIEIEMLHFLLNDDVRVQLVEVDDEPDFVTIIIVDETELDDYLLLDILRVVDII